MHIIHEGLTDLPSLLYVRTNLYDALKHLRDLQIKRVFWIDAICINQSDVHERNHKIAKMAQIYTLASRTIIWLGLEDTSDSGKRAFGILTSISERFETSTDHSLVVKPGFEVGNAIDIAFLSAAIHSRSLLDVAVDSGKETESVRTETVWKGIRKILTRPWWDRLWIYQEARLGTEKPLFDAGPT